MWFAFVVVLAMTPQGPQVGGGINPEAFQTQEECVAKNKEVEDRVFKQAGVPKEILAYSFQCKKLEKEDFKKPGLDA